MEDIEGRSGKNESASIQKLANSIRETLNHELTLPSDFYSRTWHPSTVCIYRVPENLRRVSESAYTPQLLSIGPFHHGKISLVKMDVIKWWYLQSYLDFFPYSKLESCLEDLMGLEEKTRQCYAESIKLDRHEFVTMMLLDSVFIIVFFLKCHSHREPGNDPIFDNVSILSVILHDLILLENQLPFFVLELLFQPRLGSEQYYTHHDDLFDLTIQAFGGFVGENRIVRSEVKHILDLLRSCRVPSDHLFPVESTQDVGRSKLVRHRVTELHEGGVKLKASVSGSNGILDVKFSKGVLEIQPLLIKEGTQSLFQNLIAFEQCHYLSYPYVTSYAIFLASLINTPNDVRLLVDTGIIENHLDNHEEVISFIKNLSKNVSSDDLYFSRVYAKLDRYCKRLRFQSLKSWHSWMISLRRDYCNSPWAILSIIAGFILLVLTLIQTVCSVKSLK